MSATPCIGRAGCSRNTASSASIFRPRCWPRKPAPIMRWSAMPAPSSNSSSSRKWSRASRRATRRGKPGSPRSAPALASTIRKISTSTAIPLHPARVVGALAQSAPARRHRARRFGRTSRLRRPLLRFIHAAHLYLRHQSRADGLGHPGRYRRCLCKARHPRRARDRRWLHADARHRNRGCSALSPARHLRRAQQFGTRQCLAQGPQARARARRTHQHSRS